MREEDIRGYRRCTQVIVGQPRKCRAPIKLRIQFSCALSAVRAQKVVHTESARARLLDEVSTHQRFKCGLGTRGIHVGERSYREAVIAMTRM